MLTSSVSGIAIIFTILIFLLLISFVSSRLLLENLSSSKRDHLRLANCTIDLMERFIRPKTKVLLLMENCYRCLQPQDDFNVRLLDHILQNSVTTTFQLYVERTDEQPWNYNIFIVNNAIAFNQLSFYFPESFHERDFRFLIVLTDKDFYDGGAEFRNETMHRIFATCLQFNVLNAVIMFEARDTIVFYTYNLFEPECRRRLSIVEVNRYKAGIFAEDYLLSSRLNDFQKCPLRVSAHLLPPTLSFRGDVENPKHLLDVSRLAGIEGDLIRLLSEVLNFTINLKLYRENNMFGTKFNWTSYFRELNTGSVDVAIGGLSGSDSHRFMFSVSISYHQTPFVLVVRSELEQGQFRQLLQSFELTVWLTIIFCLFVALHVIKALQDYATPSWRAFVLGVRNNSPRTNLFTISLGNPVNRLPRRNFARFILMSWMWGAMVLRSAYQAKLYDNLRLSKRVNLPHDINDLLEKNYSLLTPMFYDFYPKSRSILLNSNHSQVLELLEQRQDKLASATLLDLLDHYQQHHRDTELTRMPKSIYLYHQVMYFRKHSMLKSAFDQKLNQIISAGLTSQISKRYVNKQGMGKRHDEGVTRISNDGLRSTYFVYLILTGAALVCFGLEVVAQQNWFRFRRLRDCLQAAHRTEY